jgi:hypothetical protein
MLKCSSTQRKCLNKLYKFRCANDESLCSSYCCFPWTRSTVLIFLSATVCLGSSLRSCLQVRSSKSQQFFVSLQHWLIPWPRLSISIMFVLTHRRSPAVKNSPLVSRRCSSFVVCYVQLKSTTRTETKKDFVHLRSLRRSVEFWCEFECYASRTCSEDPSEPW